MNEKSKHSKDMGFSPWLVVIIVGLVAVILTVFDWFDVLAPFHHLNVTALSAIWGNAVVIVLFFLAYHMIDKRRLEIDKRRLEKEKKEIELLENKRRIALVMLEKTCKNLRFEMENIYTLEKIEKYAVPKMDSSKPVVNDPLYIQIRESLFRYDLQVAHFAEIGALKHNIFSAYEDLKSSTHKALTTRITFSDAYKYPDSEADVMINFVNKEYEEALQELENQIRKGEG